MEAICGILLTASFVLRIVLYKPKRRWLKDTVCFLLMRKAVSVLAATAPMGVDVFAAAVYTLITHLIADAIARRKNMIPKRHSSQRAPVRHGSAAQTPVVHHGEDTPPVPTTVPSAPPVDIPPEPVKPPVRQTLRACVRCGHKLTGPFCGECGYNQTAAPVCLLRFVDSERLQISVKKN